jgi:hypothetical protein
LVGDVKKGSHMRAAFMYGAGDVRIDTVPDPVIQQPTDALGPAPARAYIEELMPDVLSGAVQPGRVFDRTIGLDQTPDGYVAMDRREALKVLIRP